MMTLAEAQALMPAVDLDAQLKALGVSRPRRVQVRDIAALKALNKVLEHALGRGRQLLLHWHVLAPAPSALGQPWRSLEEEFSAQRKGLKVAPRTRTRRSPSRLACSCTHPLSKLYVETYFPDTTRREITQMVGHIKDEFEQRLRTNPWLDEPTRVAALDKLAKVDIQVGYPQQWIDFSALVIRVDDHFGNVPARRRVPAATRASPEWASRWWSSALRTPPYTTPTSVNAAYNPQTNSIDITAAIVQPPFYLPGGRRGGELLHHRRGDRP